MGTLTIMLSAYISLFLVALTQAATVRYNLLATLEWAAPDGWYRPVIMLNGQFPGPKLEANAGDTIVVNVTNLIDETSGTSIHWHGLTLKGKSYLDGVSGVTQCPIVPYQSLVYEVPTDDRTGTFWYHSHTGLQYQDGMFGPLIIHSPSDPYRELEEMTVMVSDWYRNPAYVSLAAFRSRGIEPVCVQSILVNGKGRVDCKATCVPSKAMGSMSSMPSMGSMDGMATDMNGSTYDSLDFTAPCQPTTTPYTVFNVTQGKTYRLRLINSAAFLGLDVSIDDHEMTVVEADGILIKEPQVVRKLRIAIGQRYSVLVKANQTVGSYYLRATRYDGMQSLEGKAILRYDGAPNSDPADAPLSTPGVECDDMALAPLTPSVPPEPTVRFEWDVQKNSPQVWSINGHPFMPQAIPTIVDASAAVVSINTGDVVEIVLNQAVGTLDDMEHPMHLHGHTVWVLGCGKGRFDSQSNSSLLNTVNPPVRDTVSLPQGGWLVLRFLADNPGTWFFHCHIDIHMFAGFGVVFNEARNEASKPPAEFVTCAQGGSNSGLSVASTASTVSRQAWSLIITASVAAMVL